MDWSQYRHHCIWLQTLRIREEADVSSVFQLGVSNVDAFKLQLQFLPYYYSDLEPIAGCCRYVPFHRDLQVSIAGHPGDSDVNLETFVLFLSYTPARFYLSVELVFIVCFLHFMHICHARHYSTLRNVHYRKRRRRISWCQFTTKSSTISPMLSTAALAFRRQIKLLTELS